MKTTYKWGASAVLFLALSSLTVVTPALADRYQHHHQPVVLSQWNNEVVAGTLNFGTASNTTNQNTNNHKQKPPQTSTSTPVTSSQGTGSTGVPATTTPKTPPVVTPPVTVPQTSASSEVRMTAYTTAYGWPDNTPASADISNPVIHQSAGGTGTFADPITLAVGHSIINGNDILDYPQGTKFYVPNLRKYFIVEDTCGDGSQPQNGPCHTGYQGHVWVDMWVGGQGLSSSGTLACEDTVTDLHTIIENPASNYAVAAGPVFNGSCAQQFGELVVSI